MFCCVTFSRLTASTLTMGMGASSPLGSLPSISIMSFRSEERNAAFTLISKILSSDDFRRTVSEMDTAVFSGFERSL